MRGLPEPGPVRTLAIASLVDSVGSALLVTTLVLYFTRIVGLSGAQVGLGLTVGGALGLLVGIPLGQFADVHGAREVAIGLLLLQGVATASYLLVGSFAGFVAAASLVVACDRGAYAVRQGLTARALPAVGRVGRRAYLNAVTNAGFGVGSALATIGIAIDTRTGYRVLIAADAVSFPLVALVLARLPRLAGEPRVPAGPRFAVLRDRPYLAVVALTALLGMQATMLDVGLPLWVTRHTAAPPATVGAIFILNCVVVLLFAVRMAAGSETPTAAARTAVRSGAAILAACALLAVSGSPSAPAAAAALIVAAMLVHAVGEMLHGASQWGLSFGLAPEHEQGQYQGAAATGFALALMLGPLVMALIVAAGAGGWLGFGTVMLACGAATVPVTRWAVAARV